MRADLHIHTNRSFDGCYSIETIINKAIAGKIDVIAITDHNTVLDKNYSNEKIQIISGIEIDCYFENNIIHLLGYGIDITNPIYQDLHNHYYQELKKIATKRLQLIEKHYNCKLDINKIKQLSNNDFFTNVEITKVLLADITNPDLEIYQNGIKSNNAIANFYWENLAIGKWGYTAMDLPDYKTIIKLIHETKGVCICAHPNVNIGCDNESINKLIKADVDGFEAYCSYHSADICAFYQQVCQKNNLLYTCGSDYHGTTKPNISLYAHHYQGDCEMLLQSLFQKMKEISLK